MRSHGNKYGETMYGFRVQIRNFRLVLYELNARNATMRTFSLPPPEQSSRQTIKNKNFLQITFFPLHPVDVGVCRCRNYQTVNVQYYVGYTPAVSPLCDSRFCQTRAHTRPNVTTIIYSYTNSLCGNRMSRTHFTG